MKNKNYKKCYKAPVFSKDVDIEKVLGSNKISFEKKIICTLLVTCKMIIKVRYYL